MLILFWLIPMLLINPIFLITNFFWVIFLSMAFVYLDISLLCCIGTTFRNEKDDYKRHDRLNYLVKMVNFIFHPNRAKLPTAFLEPTISLLVCTKNEEQLISNLLDSIVEQNFPKEKLEVLIIDESDKDSTPEIVREYSQRHPYIKLVNRFELPPKPEGYNSVSYGLTMGIEQSKGEFVVITEADCVLPPMYLHYMIQPFLNPKMGSVSSMYVIYGPALTAHLLRIDMAALLWLGLAGFHIGHPFVKMFGFKIPGICWGGSTAIRRSVFEEIGGWKGIEKEYAHDLLLGWRVTEHDYECLYTFDPRVKVKNYYTKTPIKQRLRWYKSGLQYLNKNPASYMSLLFLVGMPLFLELFLSIVIFMSIFRLLGVFPFTLLGFLGFRELYFSSVITSMLIGCQYGTTIFACLSPTLYRGYKTKKLAILVFPAWLFFQGILFIIANFKRKITWK